MIENAFIFVGFMLTLITLLMKIYNVLMKWDYYTVEESVLISVAGIFGIIVYFPMSLFLVSHITGYMGYMTGVLLMLHITFVICDVAFIKDLLTKFFSSGYFVGGGKGL